MLVRALLNCADVSSFSVTAVPLAELQREEFHSSGSATRRRWI
jgi:hypothetical protein